MQEGIEIWQKVSREGKDFYPSHCVLGTSNDILNAQILQLYARRH